LTCVGHLAVAYTHPRPMTLQLIVCLFTQETKLYTSANESPSLLLVNVSMMSVTHHNDHTDTRKHYSTMTLQYCGL